MTFSFSTRRGFLGGGLALAGTRLAGAPGETTEPDEVKLGVASYSLRKFSRSQAIEMMRQLKIRYVSIKDFHQSYDGTPAELAAGRREFEEAGLTILSGGNIPLRNPAELRKMFEYAKASGMPMMVCAPTHETLPAIEKLVKEFDIKIAIHNHGPEDRHFPTPLSALEAIRGMDPRMGLCIDIGHTARAKADILESIWISGTRLFDIHVKDLLDTAPKARQVPVGDGMLPIVGMFRLLKRMNYEGGVMLEYEIDADSPLPGMQRSVGYMRGVLAGLSG